ncbi:MAG: hypothetical protein ACD_63C00205G0003 [uncultured bacterium]|nr:MAG: hypothetical protein ACD_63C00205G0003 [uncultured bacterium]KKT01722.1 MAG: 30S ribosomal protein S6, small subunit ribosomal protein S6 [Candidatus Peregrinibacteria bacterium GW2011_GWF2_43_17]KKT20637.1 MAG: 30S ribosomal protein S6 [Candidatus Peregrinibacteria bacterium GW2011_GWA2_43_8]HAU39326.1 30S ribosomal protein S6 [Candidatus Peregrinibacteria bacterium]
MAHNKEARKYELMIIFKADKTDDLIAKELEAVKKIISDANGDIFHEDVWGRRDLKYGIKKEEVGYYVVLNFNLEPSKLKEIQDALRINLGVLRCLLIITPDDYTPRKITEEDLDFKKKPKEDKKKEAAKKEEAKEVKKEKKVLKKKVVKEEVIDKKPEITEVVEEVVEEKKPAKKEEKDSKKKLSDLDEKLKAIIDDTDLDISL